MGSSTSSDGAALQRLTQRVEGGLDTLVDDLIGSAGDLAPFAEALRYPVAAGGKRLRPTLLLATVEALGGDLDDALPAACAIELIHTFSLVHDDLPALDDDDLRRGRPTTHRVYGEDVAVLVGDGLFALAFRLVLERGAAVPERRLTAAAELARATDGMVRGQYLDLHPDGEPDEAALRRMCGLKTGCLIGAAVRMGAALASADENARRAYDALADEIGVGFQIVDDVLDATGTSEALGKTAGSDVANDRRTFVTVLGLEEARRLVEASWQRSAALLADLPGDPRALRAVVERIYRRDR
jgi:geranylgeranyl diphosphate synthase type II